MGRLLLPALRQQCTVMTSLPQLFRTAPTMALLLAAAVASSPPLPPPPLPLCTSCSSWCAGNCSFAGPPLSNASPNPRGRQNVTIYRMTAANVTDLDDKDTGDPAGDLVFNMDERAIPLVCRHSRTASKNPDCVTGNTHSWLLRSNLVYLQWVVEVSGVWGPYQMCNLNLTDRATGKPGNGKWFCDGARFDHTNFSDTKLCGSCPATKNAVGWAAMNTSSSPSHSPPVSSAACNATFERVCGGTLSNYTACRACGARNYKPVLKNISHCNWSEKCAPPPAASTACRAAAQQLCGQLRKPALRHNCALCLHNHSHLLEHGPCPGGQFESLADRARGGSPQWCPSPPANSWYNSKSNSTWVGPQHLHPNHRLVAGALGGSWFSTPRSGRCAAGERPRGGVGGGSNSCSWRPVALKKAVNYSCVQGHVAAAVMAHGHACFATCTDGDQSDPSSPSDCWLRCFFNSFIGNASLGLAPMSRLPLLQAWAQSFASDKPSEGGCPPVPHSLPPYRLPEPIG